MHSIHIERKREYAPLPALDTVKAVLLSVGLASAEKGRLFKK